MGYCYQDNRRGAIRAIRPTTVAEGYHSQILRLRCAFRGQLRRVTRDTRRRGGFDRCRPLGGQRLQGGAHRCGHYGRNGCITSSGSLPQFLEQCTLRRAILSRNAPHGVYGDVIRPSGSRRDRGRPQDTRTVVICGRIRQRRQRYRVRLHVYSAHPVNGQVEFPTVRFNGRRPCGTWQVRNGRRAQRGEDRLARVRYRGQRHKYRQRHSSQCRGHITVISGHSGLLERRCYSGSGCSRGQPITP